MSAPQRFGPQGLLEYNEKYAVLICRECQYAIQKSALQSHLLRHKIYRGDRQELLASIAHLNLLEPDQVPSPPATSAPIGSLPIISGYKCSTCGNLCASEKRMRRHWSEMHGWSELPPDYSSFFRPAKLQTFFRGTKVRYFEIGSSVEDHADTMALPLAFPLESQMTDEVFEASVQPSSTTMDLELLRQFHHYLTITSHALPNVSHLRPSADFWCTDTVHIAMCQEWLMAGLLALTASHFVILAKDPIIEASHREQSERFSAEYFLGWETYAMNDYPRKNTKIAGAQVQCILRCIQLGFDGLRSSTSNMLSALMGEIRSVALLSEAFTSDVLAIGDNGGFQAEAFLQIHGRQPGPFEMTTASLTASLDEADLAMLNRIDGLPHRLAQALGKPEDMQEVTITLSAIAMLKDCCTISFAAKQNDVAWRSIVYWVMKAPHQLEDLVASDKPAALIVLAHWAASLVKQAEHRGCWFLRSLPERIISEVSERLPTDEPAIRGLIEGLLD